MTVLRGFWRGLRTVPGHWLAGLVFMVLASAATALLMAYAPVDYSLQDTYYVVANVRYTVQVLAFFAAFACIYHFFGRIFTVHYRPVLARLHFWTFFIGLNLVYLPQRLVGLQGMPRRYIDYPVDYETWNLISSVGYAIVLLSFVVFAAVMVEAFVNRNKPGRRSNRRGYDVF